MLNMSTELYSTLGVLFQDQLASGSTPWEQFSSDKRLDSPLESYLNRAVMLEYKGGQEWDIRTQPSCS